MEQHTGEGGGGGMHVRDTKTLKAPDGRQGEPLFMLAGWKCRENEQPPSQIHKHRQTVSSAPPAFHLGWYTEM